MGRGMKDPNEIGAAAADYLRMFGLVATGWMWVRMASAAAGKEGAVAANKLTTARFFVAKILPQVHALGAQVDAGGSTVMALEAAAF
jgi:hypothetical protein